MMKTTYTTWLIHFTTWDQKPLSAYVLQPAQLERNGLVDSNTYLTFVGRSLNSNKWYDTRLTISHWDIISHVKPHL